MTTHVDFEIAKLLKEKDIIINSVFAGHGYHWYLKGEKDEFGDPLDNGTGVWKLANFNTHTKEEYYAPTVDEVKWWLYEKHGIWIWVERYSTLFRPYAEETGNKIFGKWEGHKFDSPTEAYLEAIHYILAIL